MDSDLAKLEKVDVRKFWKDEARDFTPWLGKENWIELLGETLGIQIEVDGVEVEVGNFKADILAKDMDDRKIIIENQLGKTDHEHLGKLITYAAGLDAKIVVWICDSIRDEYREAIDWLNDITNEEIAFFAVKIELWRIDDSRLAPHFDVVCSPNEWTRIVKESARTTSLTETKLLQKEFWDALKEYMVEGKTFLRLRTPRPQQYYLLAVGRSGFNLSLTVNTKTNQLGCELYIRGENAKKAFNFLEEDKEKIEAEIGEQLDWQRLSEGQDCRIIVYSKGDIREKNKWKDYCKWYKEYAEKFHKAFSKRIKKLEL